MEETPKDYQGLPIVRVCAYCQQINSEKMKPFAQGIDQKVKDEMSVVDEKVKENANKYSFTHGICLPHLVFQYQLHRLCRKRDR